MIKNTNSVIDLSPTHLRYAAALRGLVPAAPNSAFTYAITGSFEVGTFLNLAASNPEGTFYAVVENIKTYEQVRELPSKREIKNATFLSTTAMLPENLHFLCFQSDAAELSPTERERIFNLAAKHVGPNGLFVTRYQAYKGADENLQFIVSEFAPAMAPDQAKDFLGEIQKIGSAYFETHAIARTALEKAIAASSPQLFFDACTSENLPLSGTYETMAGLLPAGFSFVGDADIEKNYLELSAPASAHEILINCREHLLYEPIKDFALQRLVRNDIWVKLPAQQSFDKAELFGQFVFAVVANRTRVPQQLTTRSGKEIDLSTPLFSRILDLMCLLPMSIGDFLSHPSSEGFETDDVLAAIQILVACNIAQPMRSRYEAQSKVDLSHPVPSKEVAIYLNELTIDTANIDLASPIVGQTITLPIRDALVLQAIGRVGLSNSAGAVQKELDRIVQNNPALAAKVLDVANPTPETAQNMVQSVLGASIIKWYAYGLLAA